MATSPKLCLDGLVFPEAPRWHRGELWLSDILGHRVIRWDKNEVVHTVSGFNDRPSGLGFLADGSPVVALMKTRKIVRFSGDSMSVHADLSVVAGTHINDMIVDARGYAYVGNIRKRATNVLPENINDALVLVFPDGSLKTVAEDLRGPNGPVITPDGRTLIVAESFANRLTAFSIQEDGSLTNRRVFAELPLLPDGICLDAEGAVWIGTAFENQFLRVREGGEVVQRIELGEGRAALACVLGGDDRTTLFLLTSTIRLDEFRALPGFEADLTCTAQGSVFALHVSVPGVGVP